MQAEEGDDRLERASFGAHESGLVDDVVVAQNETQRGQLWRLRESIPAVENLLGESIKHDVSVPLAQVVDDLAQAGVALAGAGRSRGNRSVGHAIPSRAP